MDAELSTDLILQSLSNSYASFVLNYQMNKITSTIPELINMLKTAEEAVKKQNPKVVMVVNSSTTSRKKKMNKKRITSATGGVRKKKGKQVIVAPTAAGKKTPSESTCFHYSKTGHWKRNCKAYLESLKKERYGDASNSGIYVIEISTNTALANHIWVLDTGCGCHLVSSMQELRSSRKINK